MYTELGTRAKSKVGVWGLGFSCFLGMNGPPPPKKGQKTKQHPKFLQQHGGCHLNAHRGGVGKAALIAPNVA